MQRCKEEYQQKEIEQSKSKKRKSQFTQQPVSLGEVSFGHYSTDTEVKSLVISWICTKRGSYYGAGRILMDKTKEFARLNNYENIELYSMKEPVDFYKKMGFIHMYEIPDNRDITKRKENNSAERDYMIYYTDEKTGGRKSQKLIVNKKRRKTHKKKLKEN